MSADIVATVMRDGKPVGLTAAEFAAFVHTPRAARSATAPIEAAPAAIAPVAPSPAPAVAAPALSRHMTPAEVKAAYDARQAEWAAEQVAKDPLAAAWIAHGGSVTAADIEAANFMIATMALTDDEIAGVSADDRAAADLLLQALHGFADKPPPAKPMTPAEREFQNVFGQALAQAKASGARGI